jgi:hypothetical protein
MPLCLLDANWAICIYLSLSHIQFIYKTILLYLKQNTTMQTSVTMLS